MMTVPFALFLLYLAAVAILAAWAGRKYVRPWLINRAIKQRTVELEIAMNRHDLDQEILRDLLRKRGQQ